MTSRTVTLYPSEASKPPPIFNRNFISPTFITSTSNCFDSFPIFMRPEKKSGEHIVAGWSIRPFVRPKFVSGL